MVFHAFTIIGSKLRILLLITMIQGSSRVLSTAGRKVAAGRYLRLYARHLTTYTSSTPKVDQDRLWGDIHHTCQWGRGSRWGEFVFPFQSIQHVSTNFLVPGLLDFCLVLPDASLEARRTLACQDCLCQTMINLHVIGS